METLEKKKVKRKRKKEEEERGLRRRVGSYNPVREGVWSATEWESVEEEEKRKKKTMRREGEEEKDREPSDQN